MQKVIVRIVITLITDEEPIQERCLLRAIANVQEVYREPGVQVFSLAPGILLQYCGPGAQAPVYLPRNRPFISLRADGLPKAVQMAETTGARILDIATDNCTGLTICYLQMHDGMVIALFG